MELWEERKLQEFGARGADFDDFDECVKDLRLAELILRNVSRIWGLWS